MLNASKGVKLISSFFKKEDISSDEIKEMYNIFVKYYDNAEYSTFLRDFNKKDGANIVKRKDTGEIVGFSTCVKMGLTVNSKGNKLKKIYALFSGDTIMEKEYWGSTALHKATVRYAINQKIMNFGTPIYWFLICKGYKTYLLLANNVKYYWPKYDVGEDLMLENVLENMCMTFYPDNYDKQTGLLRFGNGSQKLKCDVAEITDEMKENFPKIAFFEKKNPTWREGTELPCTMEITVFNLLYGSLSQVFKWVSKAIGLKKNKAAKEIHAKPSIAMDRRVRKTDRRAAYINVKNDRRSGQDRRIEALSY